MVSYTLFAIFVDWAILLEMVFARKLRGSASQDELQPLLQLSAILVDNVQPKR